jgi:ATP/maltotriose-dependent transcriptional regulator MalT
MPSTLLATKLHRPRPTSSLVARPRLTQHLDEGLRNGRRLFLVVPPPGAMASCGTSKTMILE